MGLIRRLLRLQSTPAPERVPGANTRTLPPVRDDDDDAPAPRAANVRHTEKPSEAATGAAAWPKVIGPADAILTGAVVALVSFGVVMVYSASAVFAYSRYDNGQQFLVKQAVYAIAGLISMVVLARIDYHRLRKLTYPMFVATLALLSVTAFGFGKNAGGASRWIEVGPVHIQPAEIAKVAMICWLAHSLSKKSERVRTFSIGFLPHVLVAMVVMLLCLKQPDFGSAVMVLLLTFVLLFTAGARLGYMLACGILALPVIYQLVVGSEYRMRRITAFLSPFEYRYGVGYQIAESLMSFGAGGMTGIGIGDSRQKLFFLPEAHTDFISAIIGEELGFVGFAAMVAVFSLVLYRGLRAAYRAADDYGTYLAVGVTLFIGLQAFTNLAVAIGLLPTKGLVLPFISYGGSALLVNCGAIGILLNVSRPRDVSQLQPEAAEQRVSSRGNARVVQAGGIA